MKYPDLNKRIVVLDIEHTGTGDVNRAQICEIGAVEIVNGHIGQAFHVYVNPNSWIHPRAQKIHGLSRKHLSQYPRFHKHFYDFKRFLRGSPLVMHNAKSDLRVLAHDIAHYELPALNIAEYYCSQKLGRSIFCEDLSLDTLCMACGIEDYVRECHSALEDATLLARALIRLPQEPICVRPEGTKKRRRGKRGKKGAGTRPVCNLVENQVVWKFPDGSCLQHPIPNYPIDLGYKLRLSNGHVLVLPPESNVPANPIGPKVLYYHDGAVVAV